MTARPLHSFVYPLKKLPLPAGSEGGGGALPLIMVAAAVTRRDPEHRYCTRWSDSPPRIRENTWLLGFSLGIAVEGLCTVENWRWRSAEQAKQAVGFGVWRERAGLETFRLLTADLPNQVPPSAWILSSSSLIAKNHLISQ